MNQLLAGLALLLLSGSALCQTKIPVYIHATADANDPDAQSLVFELKDAVRGSNSFKLVPDAKSWPYIKVVIVAVESSVGGRKVGIAYSYAFVYDDVQMPLDGAFITSGVQTCPSKEIQDCARGHLAGIDRAASILQQRAPHLHKKLQ